MDSYTNFENPEPTGLSAQLQDWIDAEHVAISCHGNTAEYLTEGDRKSFSLSWYYPCANFEGLIEPSGSTTAFSTSIYNADMPLATDTPSTPSDTPLIIGTPLTPSDTPLVAATASTTADTPLTPATLSTPADTSLTAALASMSSDADTDTDAASTTASSTASESEDDEEPVWLSARATFQYLWDGVWLLPMAAEDLWDYLKVHKGALSNPRADGTVRCRWPGCNQYIHKAELRRHVRYTHQRIKKCCANDGCGYVDREDNFAYRHKKCHYGPPGPFILRIAPY